MTEVRIVPRVRTETQTIETPVSKCGDNWFSTIKIRAPYKGTDMAFRTLHSLGDPDQVESFDPMFIEEMNGDHFRITAFTRGHARSLTSKQQTNVQTMLDRAARYLRDAAGIATAWRTGFATTRAGTVPPWPLNGQPKAPVNNLMEEGHRRDQDKHKKLVRSALKNLRCAEEVAKKATIRARNKDKHQGRRFGNVGLGPLSPNDPMPGLLDPDALMPELDIQESSIARLDLPGNVTTNFNPIDEREEPEGSDLEDGEIILDEEPLDEIEEDQAPAPVAKKKKDNTLLFAGAAALGILALKGR